MFKISVIFGTRPEAIKLAPIILALKKHPDFECHVCVTAQHRQMLDQVLHIFNITPDIDLDIMKPNQTLAGLTARVVTGVDQYLDDYKPDMVLVQGDTTTVFSAALVSFYNKIPVGHVEAGLRTGNMMSPWPEEANRVLTSRIATLHFAPTENSRQNLLYEHVPAEQIVVTGNTVIDALFLALEKIRQNPPFIPSLPDFLQPVSNHEPNSKSEPRMVLITGHRRENLGQGFENICNAIAKLAQKFQDVHFVYPVHLNPNVREPVERILGEKSKISNIHLLAPLDYLPFVALMNRAHIIMTDSGGVQEEAPSLGKPVIVMRDTTERPEAVEAGTVRLVGTDYEAIVNEMSDLLTDQSIYDVMSLAHNPYGDGKATDRHLKALEDFFAGNLK